MKFLELPVEGGGKAEILEDGGAELSGNSADCLHGQVDAAHNGGDALVECTLRLGPAGAMQRSQGFEIEFEQREHLAELVVDFPRNAGTLLFAGGFDAGGELAQAIMRDAQLLLVALALGDVAEVDHDSAESLDMKAVCRGTLDIAPFASTVAKTDVEKGSDAGR